MPKMNVKGRQIKVWLPWPLYEALRQEAQNLEVKMAELARYAIIDRYAEQIAAERLQAEQQAQAEA